MFKNLFVKLTLACLIILGAWGVQRIIMNDSDNSLINQSAIEQIVSDQANTAKRIQANSEQKTPNASIVGSEPLPTTVERIDALKQAKSLLSKGQVQTAIALIEQNQVALSSEQLEELKNDFFSYINTLKGLDKLKLAERDLIIFSRYFDELAVWDQLAEVSAKLNNTKGEFAALSRAAELENQADVLQNKINRLEFLAGTIKENLSTQNDVLGIRMLYQDLANQHPNSTRFSFELAQAHIAVGDMLAAEQLLEPLKYDLEFGNLAIQQLEQINKQRQSNTTAVKKPEQTPSEFAATDLVVPLTRRGNSFLVDTSVNGRQVRMLLDTGASITSLSSQQIQRLGLEPTGQSVRLSTANGIRNAPLYRIKKIRLGRLTIEDLVIAEIEFSSNSPIQGLLGTDLLNRVNQRYSYLIDNNANALIFRRK